MSDSIDLDNLTKEQLVSMVQVRGQALEMYRHADDALMEKMAAGLNADDLQQYNDAMNNILVGLMQAEEQIIGGATPLAN